MVYSFWLILCPHCKSLAGVWKRSRGSLVCVCARLLLQEQACQPGEARLSPHVFSPSAASLMSLVIIFPPFCCLFFAESWIICVYALLLDDSCAVGLQSVFRIRWIMNKPRQQKSRGLYEPCLSSSAPAWLACQPRGRGQVSREVSLIQKLS